MLWRLRSEKSGLGTQYPEEEEAEDIVPKSHTSKTSETTSSSGAVT